MQTHCNKGHEFTPETTYIAPKTGHRHCRPCRWAYYKANPKKNDPVKMREWRKGWRERNPNYHRDHALVKKYGISVELYEQMLADQHGKCAICHETMEKPHVDHDHQTGKVRGLLCSGCNLGIGSLKDSADVLASAAEYLRKHKEPEACQL